MNLDLYRDLAEFLGKQAFDRIQIITQDRETDCGLGFKNAAIHLFYGATV